MEHEKAKRARETNWDLSEKEILRQLLEHRIDVVENKTNDTKMIAKKKAAWEAVRKDMISAGFNRSTEKIKQQWTRMKVAAKRSNSATKKAYKATGNVVSLPVCDPSDILVQAMIAGQLEEDTIYIDSNTDVLTVPTESDQNAALPSTSGLLNLNTCHQSDIGFQNNDLEFTSPSPSRPSAQNQNSAADLLSSLRQLPKKAKTKTDVMTSRAHQIDEGTSHAAELHLLQIEHAKQVLVLDEQLLLNAKEDNARAREKHLLELDQMKEYHQEKMRKF